jgi:hypothetical protein
VEAKHPKNGSLKVGTILYPALDIVRLIPSKRFNDQNICVAQQIG